MRVPDHADELPDHVDPIPVPKTKKGAEMLLMIFEVGLYPKGEMDGPAESGFVKIPNLFLL